MKIKRIELTHFRNHKKLVLDITGDTVLLLGDNASGKTSVLEAIHFAGFTSSHRTKDDKEVIAFDAPFGKIKLKTETHVFDIVISKDGKRFSVNHIEQPKLSHVLGIIPIVMFAPEDLAFIKGSPSSRRQFLDMHLGQTHAKYLHALSQYKKILKQRNDLLKKLDLQSDRIFLNIITDQLLAEAKTIIACRTTFVESLNPYFKAAHAHFSSKDEVRLVYSPSLQESELEEGFKAKQTQDILLNMTLQGPHRDDLSVLINETSAISYASQGQQRSLILALKLALVEWMRDSMKKNPIILLDDVLSELDDSRQIQLLNAIKNKGQTWITSTAIHGITVDETTQIITLKKEQGV